MGKLVIELEAKFLVPTLEVYKDYFDAKYPCTNETDDGSNMPLEDLVKYATYAYLLNSFKKAKDIYLSEYDKVKETVAGMEGSVDIFSK